MILTKVVGRIYEICFEISLWFNLVFFPIVGGILGKLANDYIGGNFVVLGVFVGLIAGVLIDIGTGFIIKLLHLDD